MLIAIEISLFSSAFDLLAVPLSETLSVCSSSVSILNDRSSKASARQSFGYTLAPLTRKKLCGPLGYAGCTLLRLCIDSASLVLVKEQVRDVWEEHRRSGDLQRERIRLQGISAEGVDEEKESSDEGSESIPLCARERFYSPYIAIEHNPFLNLLHDELIVCLRPFHQISIVDSSESNLHRAIVKGFHEDFPLDSFHARRDMREIFTDFLVPEDASDQKEAPHPQKNDIQSSYSNEGCKKSFRPRIYLGCCDDVEDLHLLRIRPTDVPLRNCLLRVSHMGGSLCSHQLL